MGYEALVGSSEQNVASDELLTIGDSAEGVLVLSTAAISVDDELEGVILGTSDHPGTAAKSLLIANTFADGDIMLAVQSGGDTTMSMLMDASAATLSAQGLDVLVANGSGLVVGHTAQITVDSHIPEFQVLGTGAVDANAVLFRGGDGSGGSGNKYGPALYLAKGRDAIGTYTTDLEVGDILGAIRWSGSDGGHANLDGSFAEISAEVDAAAAGNDDMPGRLVFKTTPDTTRVPVERMRIDNAGNVAFAAATTIRTTAGTLTLSPALDLALDATATREVVINEAGIDVGFRVESADNPVLINTDASANNIGFGAWANNAYFMNINPSYTSGGYGSTAAGAAWGINLTGAAGDTTALYNLNIGGGITTQTADEGIANIATVRIGEPYITDQLGGSSVVANAATLLIDQMPTEATNNYTLSIPAVTLVWGNAATNVFNASFGINTHTATSARTLTNVANVYIEGAPVVSDSDITATNGPYALWVNAGTSRFDGDILVGAGADQGSVVSVLNTNTATAATGANTTETVLYSYTMPAATFVTVGDSVRYHAAGVFAANGNTKTLTAYFGGGTLGTHAGAHSGSGWEVEVIAYTAATDVQRIFTKITVDGVVVDNEYDSPTQDDGATIALEIRGTNGTAAANDIVKRIANTIFYPAHS
jgi:hypothetical protein